MSEPTDPSRATEKEKTRLTYRDADGRPHLVKEQEDAAREAERGGERQEDILPGTTLMPPD